MRNLADWTAEDIIHKQKARLQAEDYLRLRGSKQIPDPPRSLFFQSGPRGFLVSWSLPVVYSDIVGWRIYKDDEASLFTEIRDRGIRQKFIESTAGATPPQVNIFISSINALGVESAKVQGHGAATAEAAAPTMPSASTNSTGTNTSSSYQPRNPTSPSGGRRNSNY